MLIKDNLILNCDALASCPQIQKKTVSGGYEYVEGTFLVLEGNHTVLFDPQGQVHCEASKLLKEVQGKLRKARD